MPSVSVIIPTYNRLDFLQAAVDSVLKQTYTNFELIVVDDGSSDGTYERYSTCKPPVAYARTEHSGVSAARNHGIRLASGQLIAFLDSDDQWLPGKLAKQTAYFQDNPGVMLCQTEETWIRSGKQVSPKIIHTKPDGDVFERSLELCVVSPSSVMMRREFFEIVGMFDENLPACEDYDLWLRTSYRMEIPLLPEPLTIKYGGHDDQLSKKLWGMDRFRVYALQKLLHEPVSDHQRKKVIDEIHKKCKVLMIGALKRHRYIYAFKSAMTGRFPNLKWGIL